ncbi:hypothetical protein MASR1M45_20060 [Candidatus Kapaibacterium sp.]
MLGKSILTLFVIFISSVSLLAQKDDIGNWFIYFGNQGLSKKWNWHNEIQYRNYNFIGDMQQLLIRTGIGYNLSDNNNNLLFGYGFIKTQNYIADTDEKRGFDEHRFFQQFITRQHFERVYLQHRYRIEERIFDNDLQLRLRYFLAVNVPITTKEMLESTIYASAYNEVFINAQNNIFDRNRLYGAIGYVIDSNFKVELGFMAQTLENTNRNQFQIVIFNNLPLY